MRLVTVWLVTAKPVPVKTPAVPGNDLLAFRNVLSLLDGAYEVHDLHLPLLAFEKGDHEVRWVSEHQL